MVGARDVASGLAIALAPVGRALRTASAVRVAADAGDAVIFGISLPDRSAALRAVEVAGAWGAPNAPALAAVR